MIDKKEVKEYIAAIAELHMEDRCLSRELPQAREELKRILDWVDGDKQKMIKCAECKFYKRDSEYYNLGDCINEEVRGERQKVIIKYCEKFFIADDFGCIFAEPIPIVKQEGTSMGKSEI